MEKSNVFHCIDDALIELCLKIPDRHVGSPGNKRSTDYIQKIWSSLGWQTYTMDFPCIDWQHGDVIFKCGQETFHAFAGPYSLSCQVSAKICQASTMEELQHLNAKGLVLLLHGELVKEQLMPKNFVFYNPEHHKRIIQLLEDIQPAVIVAATGKNPELAGSVYPFPLIEDGDFDIPSIYMKDTEGMKLLKYVGSEVHLQFDSQRIPSTGCNVIAVKGPSEAKKIVFCAHIDAKKGTPGALDNASGVAVLTGLAYLLKDYKGTHQIELLAFNGEDYYAASGQMKYLQERQNQLSEIALVINMDGAGYMDSKTSVSFYNCSDIMRQTVRKNIDSFKTIEEGEQWFQGDHMVFVMNKIPSIAVTSSNFEYLCREITHTEKDSLELVDAQKLMELSEFLSHFPD